MTRDIIGLIVMNGGKIVSMMTKQNHELARFWRFNIYVGGWIDLQFSGVAAGRG